jgi:5'-3' exonuclease
MTKEHEFTELEKIIEDLSENTDSFKSNGMSPEKAAKVIKKFGNKAKESLERGISLEEAAKEFEYSGSLFVILKDRMRKTKGFKETSKLRDILHEQDVVGAIRLEKVLVNNKDDASLMLEELKAHIEELHARLLGVSCEPHLEKLSKGVK